MIFWRGFLSGIDRGLSLRAAFGMAWGFAWLSWHLGRECRKARP